MVEWPCKVTQRDNSVLVKYWYIQDLIIHVQTIPVHHLEAWHEPLYYLHFQMGFPELPLTPWSNVVAVQCKVLIKWDIRKRNHWNFLIKGSLVLGKQDCDSPHLLPQFHINHLLTSGPYQQHLNHPWCRNPASSHTLIISFPIGS